MPSISFWANTLFLSVGLYACAAETFNMTLLNCPVEKLIEDYTVLQKRNGVEVVAASNVHKMPAITITLDYRYEGTEADRARILEKILLKKTGIIATRVETNLVSLVWNDALWKKMGPAWSSQAIQLGDSQKSAAPPSIPELDTRE